jgi:hypothetical protein
LAAVEQATRDLEVGLVVNAAYSPIGRLIDQDPKQTQRALDLNAARRCCWPTGACPQWPLAAGVG